MKNVPSNKTKSFFDSNSKCCIKELIQWICFLKIKFFHFLAQPHIEGMRRREKKLRHNGAKLVRMATDFLV